MDHNNNNNNNNNKQFVCLSGLPRTGSTLLSAILSQNPKIHAEGNSAVCQLMWDLHKSCVTNASEQLLANNRLQTIHDVVSSIPWIYYKNIEEPIILDKCRSWTIEANIQILKKFVNPNIKIIVLERSIIEIVRSFAKLYKENNRQFNASSMLVPQSEPIMRSIAGLQWAKKNNQDNTFLFISYDELINNTKEMVDKIYNFCGWEPFDHNYENIILKYPENDDVYQLQGQHKIRPTIGKVDNLIELPKEVIKQCKMIDKLLGYK